MIDLMIIIVFPVVVASIQMRGSKFGEKKYFMFTADIGF